MTNWDYSNDGVILDGIYIYVPAKAYYFEERECHPAH
jgi:hypothetical protein